MLHSSSGAASLHLKTLIKLNHMYLNMQQPSHSGQSDKRLWSQPVKLASRCVCTCLCVCISDQIRRKTCSYCRSWTRGANQSGFPWKGEQASLSSAGMHTTVDCQSRLVCSTHKQCEMLIFCTDMQVTHISFDHVSVCMHVCNLTVNTKPVSLSLLLSLWSTFK